MAELSYNLRAVEDGMVVEVAGEITLDQSPRFHTQMLEVIKQSPRRLVIDLAAVTHIDSAGVGTLVDVFRKLKKSGGQLFLTGMAPRVRGVFEITKLDQFFAIVDSVDEALAS